MGRLEMYVFGEEGLGMCSFIVKGMGRCRHY